MQNRSRDRGVIDGQRSLGHHLLEIATPEWVPQVPADTERDDVIAEVSSTEHLWNESGGGHSWPNWQVYLAPYAQLLFRN